jgi:hypothetical protein
MWVSIEAKMRSGGGETGNFQNVGVRAGFLGGQREAGVAEGNSAFKAPELRNYPSRNPTPEQTKASWQDWYERGVRFRQSRSG